MAYNITLSNGTNLVTVADGSIDTNYTSLKLIGKNVAGYGEFLNENFVQLLENFANGSEPANALQGQIWWDTTNKVLKVRNGTIWKSVSSSSSSATAPINPTVGDLWWDVNNTQLKVWSGSEWKVIGPAYTSTQGQTGAIPFSITETGGATSHIVLKFLVHDTVVAILSKDTTFNVDSEPGFTQINAGFNLSSLNGLGYYGITNNALNLGGFPASGYVRTDGSNNVTGALNIRSNAGLNVGTLDEFNIGVGSTVDLHATKLATNLNLVVNVGGIQKTLLTLNSTGAAAGEITVAAAPTTALGIATKGYVDDTLTGGSSVVLLKNGGNAITGTIVPSTNSTFNFGSAAAKFNTIYATSFNGTATDALSLGGISASSYVRSDVSVPMNTPLTILNNTGLTIGAASDFTINVTSSPNAVNLKGNTSGKGMNLSVNVGGVPTNAMSIDGATGLVTVVGAPTTGLGIATRQYVIDQVALGASASFTSINSNLLPSVTNTWNIGSAGVKWNTVYATTFNGNASTANYADLAERFAADRVYTPGTVVELGGVEEITAAMGDLSENVFGVISTQAAYLMNASAGTDSTHPPIAMQGRVPVRVIGKVAKGDRLVSAGNGLARAASRSEITPFNVIGRSLTNKTTTVEGTVEAIVKLNS
jgi:hypothetical protein